MKVIKRREVYRSKIFTVVEEEAHDPSGFHIKRAIVRHAGSAVMLVVAAFPAQVAEATVFIAEGKVTTIV